MSRTVLSFKPAVAGVDPYAAKLFWIRNTCRRNFKNGIAAQIINSLKCHNLGKQKNADNIHCQNSAHMLLYIVHCVHTYCTVYTF